ncbi:uncharacterized protein LOC144163357 [Haemaphysalis longicornis]
MVNRLFGEYEDVFSTDIGLFRGAPASLKQVDSDTEILFRLGVCVNAGDGTAVTTPSDSRSASVPAVASLAVWAFDRSGFGTSPFESQLQEAELHTWGPASPPAIERMTTSMTAMAKPKQPKTSSDRFRTSRGHSQATKEGRSAIRLDAADGRPERSSWRASSSMCCGDVFGVRSFELFVSTGSADALNCAVCKSVYNETCLTSPQMFIEKCEPSSEYNASEPFCRKTTLWAYTPELPVRVHRSCGYLKDTSHDTPCRTFYPHGMKYEVCQCSHDACNAAPPSPRRQLASAATLLWLAAVAAFCL